MQHDRRLLAFAWFAALVILFFQLGSSPLTDVDEGAFSEATREMLARGDFISPWLLDAPRFDKPVLIHWLQMLGFAVFGENAWGARLPSAVAGLAWIGCMGGWAYLIARRLAPEAALNVYAWGVLVSATCLGVPAMSRAATADALLNALMAASLLMLWKGLAVVQADGRGLAGHTALREARASFRWAALFIGLGVLTKGPVAVMVPAAASLLAALSMQRIGLWLRLSLDPLAWLIAAAVSLPWYWLQFEAQGSAFIEGFFGQHNLSRFTETMHGFSAGPLYYPAWMLIASLPWLPVVVKTLWSGAQQLRHGGPLRASEAHMAWWVLGFVVVFFSFSATKLPHYGFYGLSGLLVLMALVLGGAAGKPEGLMRWAAGFSGLCAMGLGLSPFWLGEVALGVQDPYYRVVLMEAAHLLEDSSWPLLLIALLAIDPIVLALWRPRQLPIREAWGAAWGAALCGVALYGLMVPTVMQALRGPIVEAAQVLRNHSQPGSNEQALAHALTWRLAAPSLSFAAGQVIPKGEPKPGSWVVLHAKDLGRLSQETACRDSKLVWEKTGIAVVACRNL
ncbi:MAG: hypothetical protein RLY30_1582 [Pseudomonadota bacterium]|jgi:4-amino-4-deoxy-L-arabinose transferase-like glycosyltransferase